MVKTQVLILSAGKISNDLSTIFGDLPSGMVPLNCKPAIAWIIDGLIKQKFNDIFVTVGYKKETIVTYLAEAYNRRVNIQFIDVDYTKPPGNSILSSLNKIESDDLLIVLGDTIFQKEFNLDKSFVLSSKNFTNHGRWCIAVSEEDNIKALYDKISEKENNGDSSALIGVYYLKNKNLLQKTIFEKDRLEISDLLNEYIKTEKIKLIDCQEWFDIGHIDKYYESKVRLLGVRFFNSLQYDPLLGTITKKSINTEKINNELQWYKNLPEELSLLAPKILFSKSTSNSVVMEYIGYPSLSELFLYSKLDTKIWEHILEKLNNTLSLFKHYKKTVSKEEYTKIYTNKTQSRMKDLVNSNKEFEKILSNEYVVINNSKYLNYNLLWDSIESYASRLYDEEDNCLIHGDLCLPNILYDVNSGVIKLVDPRGKWASSVYGDIKYDIAKLRHSFAGGYDFIVNDLFEVNQLENNFTIKIYFDNKHLKIAQLFDNKISQKWDLNKIKFIEGLLFTSMLPLHGDHPNRQIAMFCQGIKLLNEVLV